jgi:hypothetical protein
MLRIFPYRAQKNVSYRRNVRRDFAVDKRLKISNNTIMKMKYLWIIIIVFLFSCNKIENKSMKEIKEKNKFNEFTSEEIETKENEHIYEFAYKEYSIQLVDDFNNINDFDKYFKIENNVVISKGTLKPFTGEIILNRFYNVLELNGKRKLYFINGYLSQEEYTSYGIIGIKKGIIDSIEKRKVFTFINENKQMEYYFSTLEAHSYFLRNLPDSTFKNELRKSIIGNGFPGEFYKIINYWINEEIENEGYVQSVKIPYYHNENSDVNNKGDIGWTYKSGKVGIWKYYASEGSVWATNGEKTYEKMWVLKNEEIDDIENYKFEQ